ncbi:Asp-tRNA(Asn)/Glu-tRNA(Gln) amidotransferase subunit GatA [Sporocytophaga myxococcoides]|uniref:Asp-tRNA(Asn)/Glu-tRNA(Gln) amidotransferase subunit GatA n=1 Tax=Sporocytophaga myxococcoides TaxID=153721 RepID=UPI000404FD03|nr:Asp-tRNA(Asn)/Glu-tRNA(Gln) amidotransferase subunit GatA [Sporocytophaga myxococcoides]
MKRYNSLEEVRSDLNKGLISCRSLTEYYLGNIKKKAHLNAYLEVYETEALAKAIEVDQKIKEGKAGKLAGMVIGIKDVLCHKNHGLQGSSKILSGFISQFNGTAVQRIIDEDAIIIGRQNCDEFAMGSSNENSAFGPSLNEADTTRVPGGSSGGSAVAVQADLCLASLGSDTGGSVRQPAAFCGIYGLKPTYSRISRYGLIAYSSSFDTIGIISRSVEDAALLLEIMAGADNFDSTVSHKEVPTYSKSLDFGKKVKIGYLKESVESPGVHEDIRKKTKDILTTLEKEGHTVKPVEFSLLEYILPTYYILTTAEASSNLSRYDGVKYGYRSSEATDLQSLYKKTRSEAFGAEVKRRIMLGTFVLSAGYYDAYYTKAQKVRRLIKEQTEKILSDVDFLVIPTTPTTAFKIGEKTEDPISMYLADVFTVQANLSGIPAISVPAGNDSQGLPIGIQIMTKAFEESSLLAFSKYLTSKN